MIGCKRAIYKSLSIGPGAYIGLCQKHFENIEEETSYNESEGNKPNDQGAIMIRFLIQAVAMNFIGGKANAKAMVKEAMDVAFKIKEISQDKKITNEEKDLVVKEVQEFCKSAIKFVDEIEIPE